jgi:hypothetical protein
MRRPAGPFSMHSSTRDARLTNPRLPNPRRRGPKTAASTGDAVRRPHLRATPSRPERVRSAAATRVRQVATAARSAEASRFRAPERTGQLSRLAPDPRRGRPAAISRPKPGDATDLCSTPLHAARPRVDRSGQPWRTHICVFACTSPNHEGRRLLAPRKRGGETDGLAPVDRRRLPGVRCLSAESGASIVRVGLPHRRHPLSAFLTPSAVSSRHTLVALFRATSTRRLW